MRLVDLTHVGDLTGTQLAQLNNGTFKLPETIGKDFAIYVDESTPFTGPTSGFTVKGFRNGDVFYNAEGRVIDDLSSIRSSNGTYNPLFNVNAQGSQTQGANLEYISSRGLSLRAFKDYKPQINVSPRVSFSFPISEDALFFAHYDILTQRPENNPTLPLDYYTLATDVGPTLNNPDLKPQRKVDMQLGFQQRLTQSSGLTISAFYSELRNLIQARNITAAYPKNYVTYVNLDYGTVKGLTLEYDLRRTKNVAFQRLVHAAIREGHVVGHHPRAPPSWRRACRTYGYRFRSTTTSATSSRAASTSASPMERDRLLSGSTSCKTRVSTS